jgi:hypothetical protein
MRYDPIPALPLQGKGDQPHKPQQWLVRGHSPRQLTEELEGGLIEKPLK